MKKILVAILIASSLAIGFLGGSYAAIKTAEYWSDGEYEDGTEFYEIGYFGGATIHRYLW